MANKTLKNKILALSPYIEVAVRRLYWSSPFLINNFTKFKGRKLQIKHKSVRTEKNFRIFEYLSGGGGLYGRPVIVHSSMNGLKPAGFSPDEIIDHLLELVGDNGTLVMPTIPYFKENPQGSDYMYKDVSDLVITYDPKKALSGTGIITNKFLQRNGVVRSENPLNTLAAFGPLAKSMMKNNIDGEVVAPNGAKSSWNFCAKKDAVIIGFGVDLAHSLTMIHTAEDCHKNWPVKNWYRNRSFIINDGGGSSKKIIIKERRPHWAKYYSERTLCKDLINQNIMTSVEIDGVLIEIIHSSKSLINYLNSRNNKLYPYYGI